MEFEPVDLIVSLLAGAIALILLVSTYSISIQGTEISMTREKILTLLLAGVLSAVSMYIGARLEQDPCCKLLEDQEEVTIHKSPGFTPNQLREALDRQKELADSHEDLTERVNQALEGVETIKEEVVED